MMTNWLITTHILYIHISDFRGEATANNRQYLSRIKSSAKCSFIILVPICHPPWSDYYYYYPVLLIHSFFSTMKAHCLIFFNSINYIINIASHWCINKWYIGRVRHRNDNNNNNVQIIKYSYTHTRPWHDVEKEKFSVLLGLIHRNKFPYHPSPHWIPDSPEREKEK